MRFILQRLQVSKMRFILQRLQVSKMRFIFAETTEFHDEVYF